MKILKRIIYSSLFILIFFYISNYLMFRINHSNILNIESKKIDKFLGEYKVFPMKYIHLPIFYDTKNITPLDENYEEKDNICYNQVPQGLTKVRDSFVFTTYCSSGKHNSSIYILNEDIKRIELNNKCHLGGITFDYDNNYFWICLDNSNIAKIDRSILFSKEIIDEKDMEIFHINELNSASYITYYNNRLYVGEFSALSCGKLCIFPFILEGKLLEDKSNIFFNSFQKYPILKPISVVETPSQIQGIAFYENKLYMSQSFGRRLNSHILIYNYNDDYTNYTSDYLLKQITLPPLLEEIYIENDNLYLLFESAAKKYQFTTLQPIDKIIEVKL